MTFFTDYSAARRAFLEAAAAAGAVLQAHEHPAPGPDGGKLWTDEAWIGPPKASRVLVMASATHGIEGVAGSGIQSEWLRRGEASHLPPDTAVLMIHAINPWGFAWLRRTTHENVDLNRNWIDFDAPSPENKGYDELADALLPLEWTADTPGVITASIMAFGARNGMESVRAAMSGGQYRHPEGIFFGGTKPTWSRETLTHILQERLTFARHIGIVDYHTGLGDNGLAEQMAPSPPDSPNALRAAQWFGAGVIPVGAEASSSAVISGDWISQAPRLLPHANLTGIALEFGTLPAFTVLEALIADNWLHARGDPSSDMAGLVKQKMLAAFYGDSDLWRGMVLGQSLLTCRHALKALSKAS